MAEFLIEFYVSRDDSRCAERAERARLGAEALTREGTPVRLLRSILVPADETCFLLYEAASAEVVRVAAEHAALPCGRISEAFDGGAERTCSS